MIINPADEFVKKIKREHTHEIIRELTNLLHQHQRSRRHNFYLNGLLDAIETIGKMEIDTNGQL